MEFGEDAANQEGEVEEGGKQEEGEREEMEAGEEREAEEEEEKEKRGDMEHQPTSVWNRSVEPAWKHVEMPDSLAAAYQLPFQVHLQRLQPRERDIDTTNRYDESMRRMRNVVSRSR